MKFTSILFLSLCSILPFHGFCSPIGTIKTDGLNQEERTALESLLKQGACPCDQSKTLYDCAQASSCPAAVSLANYGVERFKEGLSAVEVQQAVIKKYLNEHVRYRFDFAGTPSKGPKNATIRIVEFADFQCGHCARVSAVLHRLHKAYNDVVSIHFKQFPMDRHPLAHYAARSALAAHQQAKFWAFHDLIFKHQPSLTTEKIDGFATELGLDIPRFIADRDATARFTQIARDKREAIAAHLTGTPGLYINGRKYTGKKDLESLRQLVESELESRVRTPKNK